MGLLSHALFGRVLRRFGTTKVASSALPARSEIPTVVITSAVMTNVALTARSLPHESPAQDRAMVPSA
jgi:hypothetical protein